MRLVKQNCLTYNPPMSDVIFDCREVFSFYDVEYQKLLHRIQVHKTRHAPAKNRNNNNDSKTTNTRARSRSVAARFSSFINLHVKHFPSPLQAQISSNSSSSSSEQETQPGYFEVDFLEDNWLRLLRQVWEMHLACSFFRLYCNVFFPFISQQLISLIIRVISKTSTNRLLSLGLVLVIFYFRFP